MANLTDTIHTEIAAGYKGRDFDDHYSGFDSADWDQWTVLGGIYYDPVEQLTVGVEGDWVSTELNASAGAQNNRYAFDSTNESYTVDFVSIWRF